MKGIPDDNWVQTLDAPDLQTESLVSPGPWLDHLHEWSTSALRELAEEIHSLHCPIFETLTDELHRRDPPPKDDLPANTFLARVRLRLGLSQAELARNLSMSLATLKSVESGRRLLSTQKAWVLIRFARSRDYRWHRGADEQFWDLNLSEDIPKGDILWKPVAGEHNPYGNYSRDKP